jgi:allantoin racemase
MEIRVITPITSPDFSSAEEFSDNVGVGTRVSHVQIEYGPASIESAYDEALAAPDTIQKIVDAERDGVDAVVINCMGDPGMHAGREVVSIPVIGPCEASMHLASMLGHKFSVITVLDSLIPQFSNQAKVYGVPDKLASVRSVGIPVLELEDDFDAMVGALVEQAVSAVTRDGADVIVFGCTGMLGAAEGVRTGLESHGISGVPVIDPMVASVRLAEALTAVGLTHSKRTYPAPPEKAVVGYR